VSNYKSSISLLLLDKPACLLFLVILGQESMKKTLKEVVGNLLSFPASPSLLFYEL
jgi:hypothetical protein